MQRVLLLKSQLAASVKDNNPDSLHPNDPKTLMNFYRQKSTINPEVFRQVVNGIFDDFDVKATTALARDPIFRQYTVTEATKSEQRHNSFQQLKKVYEIFGPFDTEKVNKDVLKMPLIASALYSVDPGLATKFSVHSLLYAKTIYFLGTEKHTRFCDNAYKFDEIGCFALTELSHGSNVQGIKTRAEFDPKYREFVINTPIESDMKVWIGAAGHIANMALVFAQMYIGDKNYGVHAFIVPIRNKKDHSPVPGVTIGDMGLKVGLNAVDNGFIMFRNVRVPYDNMLDKFSSINDQGKFTTPIKNPNKRFALMVGALGGGRLVIMRYSLIMLTNALTVATRFATVRRQFGLPKQTMETNIMEYPLVQYRLIPYLAELFALKHSCYTLFKVWGFNVDKLFEENNPMMTETHALTSALKPIASWLAQQGIQECREVCGGLGYSAYNRLGAYREENDINTTWEGDNNVLLQQTAKFLLDCMKKLKMGSKDDVPYPSMYFLTEDIPTIEPVNSNEESEFFRDGYDVKKALEMRANMAIHGCFNKLAAEFENGKKPMDIWNDMQVFYLQNAAKSYADLYNLNQYHELINECKDEATANVFRKLCELFAYNKLEKSSTFMMEIKYFAPKDLTYVREKVTDLCKQLKDEVVGIIDAIALPDELLNSPIGAADGDIYNRFINTVWGAPGAFEKAPYWKDITSIHTCKIKNVVIGNSSKFF